MYLIPLCNPSTIFWYSNISRMKFRKITSKRELSINFSIRTKQHIIVKNENHGPKTENFSSWRSPKSSRYPEISPSKEKTKYISPDLLTAPSAGGVMWKIRHIYHTGTASFSVHILWLIKLERAFSGRIHGWKWGRGSMKAKQVGGLTLFWMWRSFFGDSWARKYAVGLAVLWY